MPGHLLKDGGHVSGDRAIVGVVPGAGAVHPKWWRRRPTQLHNAYVVETVTIYYRWHPLFGLTLPVRARRKGRLGERVYCESDSKIYPIPSWMLSPECSQLLLGPPLISAEALCELHDLLTSLPVHANCDRASLKSLPKEGVDEAIGKITPSTNKSSTPQRTYNSSGRHTAKRIDNRSDGTANRRSRNGKRATGKRRRG